MKYKASAIIILGILTLVSTGTHVLAARGTLGFDPNSKCKGNGDSEGPPNDYNNFPYGFMCGSDPAYLNDVPVNNNLFGDRNTNDVFNNHVSNDRFNNPYQGSETTTYDLEPRKDVYYKDIPSTTTSITFDVGYKSADEPPNTGNTNNPKDGPNRSRFSITPKVLDWVTIDANDNIFKNNDPNTAISGSNGTVDDCPGGGNYAPVVNFRDLKLAKNNGPDASPYALSQYRLNGTETCGSAGSMIYWRDSGVTAGDNRQHKFTIQLKPGYNANSAFCVRENISVEYGGSDPLFPLAGTSEQAQIFSTTGGSQASHLAKQSIKQCFQFKYKPLAPTGLCASISIFDDNANPANGLKSVTYATVSDDKTPNLVNTKASGGGPIKASYQPANRYVDVTVRRHYHQSYAAFKVANPGYSHTSTYYNNHETDWPTYQHLDASGNDLDPHGRTECFSASCKINSITGDGPGGIVVTNGAVYVNATITNTGPQPLVDMNHGHSLSLALNGVVYHLSTYGYNGLGPPGSGNESVAMPVTLTGKAPGNITDKFTITGVAGYENGFLLGSTCSQDASTYKKFTMSVNAAEPASNTIENPSSIPYKTYVTTAFADGSTDPINITDASVLSQFTKNDVDVPGIVPNDAPPYEVPKAERDTLNGSYTPPAADLINGYKFCSKITLNSGVWNTGYVGPGGVVADGPNAKTKDSNLRTDDKTCTTIKNQPYVHFNGGDVTTGGCFGINNDNCGGSRGGLFTYLDTIDGSNPRGSGAQFGAQSLGVIKGFRTGSLKYGRATQTALTFANSGGGDIYFSASGGTPDGNLGGSYGVQSSSTAAPDYFAAMPSRTIPYTGPSSLATTRGQYAYKSPSNTLTIGDLTVQDGVNATIYVDGDVYINGDIKYADSDSWVDNVADIPSMFIIAKGHIYIAPTVRQLDGVYVAQPKTGGVADSGTIDTCAADINTKYGNGSDAKQLLTPNQNCGYQLVVNGAFQAKKINLNRTFSSLRYGQYGETLSGSPKSCGQSGIDVNTNDAGAKGDCAAEIFNFSPELYMARPAAIETDGTSSSSFESITSLAPVL